MIIFFALLLGIASLVLSAVFSGTETAFYHVSKLRLKLDALAGDVHSKRFLWLTNNPGFFIATLLIGNNSVNYGASLAMVLFIEAVLPKAELAATLLLTPILFVWGEMFPKFLALHIPNRMLRFLAPVLLTVCWLFLPLTVIVWGFNILIAWILKKKDDAISLTLGRRELSGFLAVGKETGILSGTQRQLAEGIFNCSDRLLKNYTLPMPPLPTITTAMKPEFVLEVARQFQMLALPVYESEAVPEKGALPIGYARTIDLEIAVRHQLDEQTRQLSQLLQTALPLRSVVELSSRHSLLTGLILLQTMQSAYGCVVDEHHRCLGFVSADQLRDVLLKSN